MKEIIRKYKNELIVLFSSTIMGLIIVLLMLANNGVFGSNEDWINQHVILADFIRQDFFNTGNIFPDYTLLLGGGINYSDISYYGIMRPEIIISFLFPFIPTYQWIVGSSILIYILTALVCYKWLKYKLNDSKSALFSSLFLVFSSGLLIHTFYHLMFANYLIYVITLLYSIDKYNDNNNYKYVIIISTLLLICSSYYFAVGSLIICGMYVLVTNYKDVKLAISKIVYMFSGVLLSSFFLIPTILDTLSNSRPGGENSITLLSLLIPDFSFKSVLSLGDIYAVSGISIIIVFALVYNLLVKNNKYVKQVSLLTLAIIVFPIFQYIFSGFDYLNTKVLIPLIPLMCLCIGFMYKHFGNNIRLVGLTSLISTILLIVFNIDYKYVILLVIECLVLSIILIISCRYNKKILFVFVLIPCIINIPILQNFISKNQIKLEQKEMVLDQNKKELVKETLDLYPDNTYRFNQETIFTKSNQYFDPRMYQMNFYSSVMNQDYATFYHDVAEIPFTGVYHSIYSGIDPIAQFLSSNRFLLINDVDGNCSNVVDYKNYEVVNNKNGYCVIKNDDVLPLAYISDNNISIQDFNNLSTNQQLYALSRYGVVEDGSNQFSSSLETINPNYQVIGDTSGLEFIHNKDGSVTIKVEETKTVQVKIDREIRPEELLLINFDVTYPESEESGAINVRINNQYNATTYGDWMYIVGDDNFVYKISSSQPFDTIDVEFSEGEYTFNNINTSVFNFNNFEQRLSEIKSVDISKINENKLVLEGSVNVEKEEYLMTTLPYMEGYSIYIDNQEVEVEKVNEGFIGAKITPGEHQIKITYNAPGKTIGDIVSIITLFSIIISALYTQNRNKKM